MHCVIACKQAVLFGKAKRASREPASEGPFLRPRGFAAGSRVLARLVSFAQIGELARRLIVLATFSLPWSSSLLKLPTNLLLQMACFNPKKVISKPQFPFLDLQRHRLCSLHQIGPSVTWVESEDQLIRHKEPQDVDMTPGWIYPISWADQEFLQKREKSSRR